MRAVIAADAENILGRLRNRRHQGDVANCQAGGGKVGIASVIQHRPTGAKHRRATGDDIDQAHCAAHLRVHHLPVLGDGDGAR